MFTFFSKKRIPQDKFETCVLECLEKKVTGKKAIGDEFRSLDLLRTLSGSESRERECVRMYQKMERYISEEQPKHRISKEVLREYIFNACRAERAEGNLVLLFLPASLRKLRIIEKFTDLIFTKARGFMDSGEYGGVFVSLKSRGDLIDIVQNEHFEWSVLEQRLKDISEARKENIEDVFKPIINQLFSVLSEKLGSLRAEKIFRETYRGFREQLIFLEEVPRVLNVLPKDLLEEERVSIMPKMELEKEVKRQTKELEYALAELREEKEKLAKTLEKLQAVDRAKGDFISVVSHQFRTPLSVIRWSVEVLEEKISALVLDEKKEEILRQLADIRIKSLFLINILQDIYDVLVLEGEETKIERSPNQLWELISDTLESLKKEARRKDVVLVFDRTNILPEEALFDRKKITRVLDILIRNAIQYTKEKGQVTIILGKTTLHEEPAFGCTVEDTGIGIKKDDIPKIFTKFFRAKNAIQAVPDGAGLGLYLAKQFIEAHKGEISVESELGNGTSFTFILPKG